MSEKRSIKEKKHISIYISGNLTPENGGGRR